MTIVAFVQCNRCLQTFRAQGVHTARVEAARAGWKATSGRTNRHDYCPDCLPHLPQLRRAP